MRRGSSRSLSTLTTRFQFVDTFTIGAGNSPFIAITFLIFFQKETKKQKGLNFDKKKRLVEKKRKQNNRFESPVA